MSMAMKGLMSFFTAKLYFYRHGQSLINGQDCGHQIIKRLSTMHLQMAGPLSFGFMMSPHSMQMISELFVGFTKVKIRFCGQKEKALH